MQLVAVELAELGVSSFHSIRVGHTFGQCAHHGAAVRGHLGIAQDRCGIGQVTKCSEVPLSPRIHNQNSVKRIAYLYQHHEGVKQYIDVCDKLFEFATLYLASACGPVSASSLPQTAVTSDQSPIVSVYLSEV